MSGPWRMVARRHGGPEVIEREDFDPGAPGAGEVLIAQEAVGLNFIDTYFRTGLYPAPLPVPLGAEGAGRIAAVGPGVDGLAVGDRVACASGLGAYATHRIVPADHVVPIPDGVSLEDAAAMMLKGMTACYLAEDTITLAAGQVALVHAAAGGVGSVLVPWLRDKGVVVIAHCGPAEKAATVRADHSLHGPFGTLAATVLALTGGRGVDVVYDGVGKDSWDASLASLRRRGLMVSYGNASGAVPPVSLLDLGKGPVALRDAPVAIRLCRHGGGTGRDRRPALRPDGARRRAGVHRPALPIIASRRGAPRAGRAQNDRVHDSHPLTQARVCALANPPRVMMAFLPFNAGHPREAGISSS